MTATATAASSNPASDIFTGLNGTSTAKSGASKTVSDAQNRFLTLLTTQLKNQDPLNPLDNAQMTSQLAQISTVDGIERLNATLSKLIEGQSQSQTLQSASLVGRGVLVPGGGLTLQSGAGLAGFELAGPADNATVEIKDGNGLVVRTIKFAGLQAGVHPFQWDGKTDAGSQAVDGKYSFTVAATQGGEKVTADKLQYGVVNSVAGSGTGIQANLGSLGQFPMSDIKQIL